MTVKPSKASETQVAVDLCFDPSKTIALPLARRAGVDLPSGRSRWISLFLLWPLVIVAVGCKTEVQQPAAAPPKVTVGHPVQRELTDEDEFNGLLESPEVVELRARVRGHIQKVHFQDGEMVEQGQLLFELDPRPFQVQIDQTVAQSQALEAQKIAADKIVARYKSLLEQNAASAQELEEAVADAGSFEAQVLAKQEEAKTYQLDLEFSRITAPISGRIGRALLTEGNLVNAGGSDPILTTIVSVNPVYAYFSIDERTLQRYMRARQADGEESVVSLRERKIPFRFGLDSDSDFPHEGILEFADNRIDSGTGTVEVRGVVENKQGLFVPGSRVKIRIPAGEPYNAVLIPDTAILSDQDIRYVLVVDDKNVVTRRDITPAKLLDDGLRVILPGRSDEPAITSDDRIIVMGLQRARINYPVEPIQESTSPAEE
ncbi:efflux RND transporter periplasmic adaptor subunit [Novipirellula artificiosorum]|uniref:Efflux pump periplasmic linker BepF n=1 Tax=Novipirellula artificiosorum TaxID=2528016 RepID=A0A5C6D560_9BACT|nr:efflux RND transporter periplasmic adaptor subunit [Novipirellula artificiosorum]TWU30817.1 Efflux pump periplasmic linker BepF [Novipirellula artificiosorum]